MGIYRKFARSKKGMSTIFGGLFFIILILMGFNLMLWGFIQNDAYNSILSGMTQRDQQALSENLVPVNPGATDRNDPLQTFNITVNNLGGVTVSIARIYITNISPTNSSQCTGSSAPCVVDPSPAGRSFTNGNIGAGEIGHKIQVSGILIFDGSGYKVVLATTRGRLFSFFYPWPQSIVNNGQGIFQTNVGPLTIFFDFKSFNFTWRANSTSAPAWSMPNGENLMVWVKVTNSATDSSVTLAPYSSILFEPYSAGGVGAARPFWIVDSGTISPLLTGNIAYNTATNPYVLQPANPNGPGTSTVVKFGSGNPPASSTLGTTTSQSFPNSASVQTWLVFIGFFYYYRGQFQGETVPFVAIKTCPSIPC